MNKSRSSEKKLILKEQLNITALVMAVLAIFVSLVAFLVPYSQQTWISRQAYRKLDSVVVNAINAAYGFGSSSQVNPDQNEEIFVVINDIDGELFLPNRSNTEKHQSFLPFLKENEKNLDHRFNHLKDDYYLSIMDANYIESSLLIEKSQVISTRPIDIPDEAIIYAGINRHNVLEGTRQFAFSLLFILLFGYLLLIVVVFMISKRIMKPTRDALKHEKEFIANASHELKTPLAIITASAEILKDKNPENTTLVNNVISQCSNMNETILDMIELSKLETSPSILESVNFSQLLLNLCLSFDAVAFEKEIQYDYKIAPDVILPLADKKNLTRLVNLLIDNALKYTEGEKIIKITLTKTKHGGILKIYNSGCQVHDEDREKVFQRFYQGRSGADDERKGSGLGLAIVKQICNKNNYSLRIESQYLKETAFIIELK